MVPNDKLQLKGEYVVEHIRDGKVIDTVKGVNLIVNTGKNKILDVMFGAVTQITAWYIGLVNNTSFTAFAAGDTHASHAGWVETTPYSDSTRQEWEVDAASAQAISNGTAAIFNINATATIKGIFVSDVSTKGDTGAGTLWNGVAFSSNIPVNSGDQLRVTYTVSC